MATPEQRLRLSAIRKTSPRLKEHLERLHKSRRGKEPKYATAATLATRKLKSMGLTREEYPELWGHYKDLFLQRRG